MAHFQRLEAADRVNMLMVFVPFLLEHSPVSVDHLASTFELSREQVRELVALLAVSGVPGHSGAYQHQDLFDIDWDLFEQSDVVELWNHVALEATPRFSSREAATLVAGLNYLHTVVTPEAHPRLLALMNKIAQGTSAVPESITVASVHQPPMLSDLTAAIAAPSVVTFSYITSTGVRSQRTVSPLRVDVVGHSWYLRGWCHDRKALRTFRLDRMTELARSNATFNAAVAVTELPDELFTPSRTDIVAEVRTLQTFLPSLSEYMPELVASAEGGQARVCIRFAEEAGIVAFAAKFAGHVEILTPQSARSAVSTWAAERLAGGVSALSQPLTP
jgi:proteasome accessory factor C